MRTMTVLLLLLAAVALFPGCSHARPSIEQWMLDAFGSCVEAQIQIGNPLVKSTSRGLEIKRSDEFTVDIILPKNVPLTYVVVRATKPYLDSVGFFCRLNKDSSVVLYALYFEGLPGSPSNREETFLDHDPTFGFPEEELDDLLKVEAVYSFPLREVLGH